MNHDTPAVVLDLSATGIGIIRSLKKKGINVYAFDVEGKYKIGKTRYASCGSCPNPVTEERGLLQFLLHFRESSTKKAVLYAGSDDYVQFISKNRDELSQFYLFLLPEQSLIEAVLDKRLTYELALTNHVNCPNTIIVSNENELDQAANEITFPCILKPVHSSDFRKKIDHHLYKKAIVIEEASQLKESYLFYRSFGELMIQEIITGDEACIYSVKTFFDEEMNLIGLWMNQKLQQFPPHYGTSALALSIRDEEVVQTAVSFLTKLQLKGLAITEFKRDKRDGALKFVEINPRMGLTQRLSMACGVDLIYLYYLSLTGQQPKPVIEQQEGMKWVYFVRHLLSFRQKHQNKEITLFQGLKSLSGRKTEALFAWDDPMPFVRSFVSHVKNLWRRQ